MQWEEFDKKCTLISSPNPLYTEPLKYDIISITSSLNSEPTKRERERESE